LNAHTLAKKSGVSYGTVWKIFRGEQVTGTTLLKIVAVIPDLSIADITIPIDEPIDTPPAEVIE
jgi:predicted transcriptional regulator